MDSVVRATRPGTLMLMVVSAFSFPSVGFAQEGAAVSAELDAAAVKASEVAPVTEDKEGWEKKLSVGTSFSSSSSKRVVGASDGSTLQWSVLSDGVANFRQGQHQWLNEAKFNYTSTQTPSSPFIKTADSLDVRSTYFYSLEKVDWLGPFARFNLNTSVFPTYLARGAAYQVNVLCVDGTSPDTAGLCPDASVVIPSNEYPAYSRTEKRFQLAAPLEPMQLKQVVGALANPIDKGTKLKVTGHVGAGAEELMGDEAYYIVANSEVVPAADDLATEIDEGVGQITVQKINPYQSVGAELELAATGTVNTLVSWNAAATFFQPIKTTADTTNVAGEKVSGVDIMNITAEGKVSIKIAKWASLDSYLSAKRQPLVTRAALSGGDPADDWQVQGGILLTATFNVL